MIGLAGQPEPLLEVSEEDAAAYNEDWTGLRGRGGPVTRARLARWWEALGRDIVLITVRGQAPQNAAALAPEGRVLGQLFESAQRSRSGAACRARWWTTRGRRSRTACGCWGCACRPR